jgi:hypothetical protein
VLVAMAIAMAISMIISRKIGVRDTIIMIRRTEQSVNGCSAKEDREVISK